ncbi:MAG: 16S rRNA (uracil(1498)-N(3))-methyltransferase [Bacteroidetes bacterium]|nr:16S rRNA (uracil(1498)-N(3))-methyltransferase [Bacteroidota bacterium]
MILFYSPDINDDQFTLSPEESRHCIRVLRMQTGDEITLTDGSGNFYEAEILTPDARKCILSIKGRKRSEKSRSVNIHLAVAPTKNISRFEWFLEKATEIGVDEITPIICSNSERTIVKIDRLNKVIIAAMKQSMQAWRPLLNEPVSFFKFIKNDFSGQLFIPWVSDEPLRNMADVYEKGEDVTVLIGPEGDFTPEEIKSAVDANFKPVSLGANRLRTETAAIVACHTLNLVDQGGIKFK